MLDVFMPINPKDKRYTVLYEGHTKDPKKPFFRRIDLFFPYNVYKYMYRMRPLEEKRYNSKEDFLNDEEIIERNAIPDFFISAIKSGIIGVIPEDILLVLREYSPDLANIIESRERNYNDDSGPGGDNR